MASDLFRGGAERGGSTMGTWSQGLIGDSEKVLLTALLLLCAAVCGIALRQGVRGE